jgi:hypothetical protein
MVLSGLLSLCKLKKGLCKFTDGLEFRLPSLIPRLVMLSTNSGWMTVKCSAPNINYTWLTTASSRSTW